MPFASFAARHPRRLLAWGHAARCEEKPSRMTFDQISNADDLVLRGSDESHVSLSARL